MSAADIEQELAALEAVKADAREKERALLVELAAAKEAEDDEAVRAYWGQRAAEDPDDPEVLRARADLIARSRGKANGGTVVDAKAAVVKGRAY